MLLHERLVAAAIPIVWRGAPRAAEGARGSTP